MVWRTMRWYGVRWYGVRWYGVRWYGVRCDGCLIQFNLLYNKFSRFVKALMRSTSKSKQSSRKEINIEPLIYIAEADVAIYPHNITKFTKKKLTTLQTLETVPSTLHQIQYHQVITFSNCQYAFKIDQKINSVAFIHLKNQKKQLQFTVQRTSQLIIVQEILRKKLCEMGFQENYKIIKQLGKGATAKVYLVQRLKDKKLFAAKIMSVKEKLDKQYETFVNEARILKSLKCPFIVSIESLYISKKQLISVLEYLEGGTLLEELRKDLINTTKLKFHAVKNITEGLEHLRQKRIVHRDIKLENILIRINKDKSKEFVLTDFGLATWMGEKELLYEKCGTPGYIAPEILRSSKGKIIISHSSDVFSLGVIYHFIFILKAVFPYTGNTKELLLANKKAVFSLDTKYHFCILPIELELLQKTLEIQPAKRVSTKEILEKYLVKYQNEMNKIESQKGHHKEHDKKIKNRDSSLEIKKNLHKSIEMKQQRNPSMKKNFLSIIMKTEKSEQKKKPNLVKRAFTEVWSKISSQRSEGMKIKDNEDERKKEMKDFIQ